MKILRSSCVTAIFVLAALIISSAAPDALALSDVEKLGKAIFFDNNLSLNGNQSCAACHAADQGWTGSLSFINAHGAVYEGSIPGRFGNRKPPSSGYATASPIFHFDEKSGLFIGGNFWDGRATGEKLGNPAADQAQGPFLNPLEQALPDAACVVYRVCTASYDVSLETVFAGSCALTWPGDTEAQCLAETGMLSLSPEDRTVSDSAYDNIALAVAAYEASSEVSAYTSKFDYAKKGKFRRQMNRPSRMARRGFALFKGKGKCKLCHLIKGKRPLLTDFTYDNLGVPRNPENPFYTQFIANPDGDAWVDRGLGGFLTTRPEYADLAAENMGKHKVPTLRNVAKGSCEAEPGNPDCIVKAYGHNGYFKSLWQIVHFYNTRDVKPECPDPFTTVETALAQGCWPSPEIPENVNTDELGDLGLTLKEERAIVEFLKALSDGFMP